jgi:hypothetical protein
MLCSAGVAWPSPRADACPGVSRRVQGNAIVTQLRKRVAYVLHGDRVSVTHAGISSAFDPPVAAVANAQKQKQGDFFAVVSRSALLLTSGSCVNATKMRSKMLLRLREYY